MDNFSCDFGISGSLCCLRQISPIAPYVKYLYNPPVPGKAARIFCKEICVGGDFYAEWI